MQMERQFPMFASVRGFPEKLPTQPHSQDLNSVRVYRNADKVPAVLIVLIDRAQVTCLLEPAPVAS